MGDAGDGLYVYDSHGRIGNNFRIDDFRIRLHGLSNGIYIREVDACRFDAVPLDDVQNFQRFAVQIAVGQDVVAGVG